MAMKGTKRVLTLNLQRSNSPQVESSKQPVSLQDCQSAQMWVF